jgi:hypothetical protein
MNDDPLVAFISRSLGERVSDVRSEIVARNAAMEIERIRFLKDGELRTLVLKRVPPTDALEVQLLPFLARKSDRVPRVHARGIPPAAAHAWPWILTEDLVETASACHGDASAIVRAKVALERAVAGNEPALRALGVQTVDVATLVERSAERAAVDRPLDDDARLAALELDSLPRALCHGELVCANARVTQRGVALLEWRRAHLGCGLLDVARLAADVRAFSDREPGDRLFELYGELRGMEVSSAAIRGAKLVERMTRAVK